MSVRKARRPLRFHGGGVRPRRRRANIAGTDSSCPARWSAEERRANPARLQGEASGSGRASLEERLDSLQNALCALEDRLDDDTGWAQNAPTLAGRGKPRDWDGRVAQLEVTVHALEEQFEASIHSTAAEGIGPPTKAGEGDAGR